MKGDAKINLNEKYTLLKQAWVVFSIAFLFLIISCDEHLEGKQGAEKDSTLAVNTSGSPGGLQENLPVREPKGAGSFYPKDAEQLYTLVDKLLAKDKPLNLPGTRAVLVPHAGYVYSGEVAAAAMRELSKEFDRVFILAANHSGEANFFGVSLPQVSSYAIPGTEIPLSPLVDELRKQSLFTSVSAAHTAYMIEVELPFLYTLAGRERNKPFSIIPMIVGRLDRESIQKLAETLGRYADERTVFVFSVDLSHFYPDSKARKLDYASIDAVLSRNTDALAQVTTDGNHVLMTMVELAELNGWDATLLKYKNSGDVSGDRDRVVGYAGIAFHQPVRFSPEQRKILLNLARETIEEHLEPGKTREPAQDVIGQHTILGVPRGVFVTLKKHGELRGCIGDLISNEPLYRGVKSFAIKSATQDPRFKPVTRDELDDLVLSISVLEYPRMMKVDDPRQYAKLLKPGRDGVILMYNGRSSTYLPQVWEDLPDPVNFLSRLCMKQGAPANCWLEPETVLFKYSAYEFGEE
jgi:AmmeMemoRadiSam system protein B/AmmeMemoRadiSam system protein A